MHGAEVVLEGETLFEAGKHARELAARDNLVFVHPYEDPLIIAGQGTVGARDARGGAGPRRAGGAGRRRRPDLRHGHRGQGAAVKNIEIYGVESQNYPSMHQRLAGQPVECGGDTIAEGIAVKDVGNIAFGIIQKLVEEVLVVKEETIERAVVALIEIEKTVAEGAGAAALGRAARASARFSPASASACRSPAATSTAACSPRC